MSGESYGAGDAERLPVQGVAAGAGAHPEVAPGTRVFVQLRAIAETLILTIVIFFVVQTFVAQPFVVKQVSMEQSLLPGQSVLVDKLTPRFDDYSRGDVVVFYPPTAVSEDAPGVPAVPFIKRVIGLPGDLIQLRDGAVYVNGVKLDEPYLFDDAGSRVLTDPESGETEWRIPKDSLFVMGDHRGSSVDARSFGPIPVSSVIGRAVLRYWPLDAIAILQTPTYAAAPSAVSANLP